jgi:hypothetical protein
LTSSSTRRWVDTNSYSTQTYAFLTGRDSAGAIGIAYLGTACFRVSGGKFIHVKSKEIDRSGIYIYISY